jgi:hypothetical protein
MSNITPESSDLLLGALGEQLAARGERFELVVIGGSALLALGLVERTTKDVDIVAIRSDGEMESADPLPDGLVAARDLVARDFSLLPRWLNPGPRKHEADLRALDPTEAELIAAARWSRSHDPSPAYAESLRGALEFLGVSNVDLQT